MVPAGRRPGQRIPEYNKDVCRDCKAGARQPCVDLILQPNGKYRTRILYVTHRTTGKKQVTIQPDRRKKKAPLTWVPVHLWGRNGTRLILKGESRTKLSETILAPAKVEVMDRAGNPVGKIRTITNNDGELTVIVKLNDPGVAIGPKFLLGLGRRGLHAAMRLYEAGDSPKAELSQPYVGMRGEEL